MRRPPHLLRADALGLESCQTHGSDAGTKVAFGVGELRAFQTWVQQCDLRRPFRLVVELADESFEIEDLPRAGGADRRALLARRLSAGFPRAMFARSDALSAPGHATPQRSERVLFSGLTRADALAPWVDSLLAAGARFDLLVPASRLVAHFALSAGEPRTLIVHFTRAGMRLTLGTRAQPLFARLVPEFSAARASTDVGWIEEVARTVHYLCGRHELALSTVPPIKVLSATAALAGAEAAQHDGRFHGQLAFLAAPASANSTDCAAEQALWQWLQRAPRTLGWQDNDARRTRRLAYALLCGGLATACASSALAALHWRDAQTQQAVAQQLSEQDARERRALSGLDTGDAQARRRARQIVDTLEQLEAHLAGATQAPVSAHALFQLLAAALADFPQAVLQTLDWRDASAASAPDSIAVELVFAAAPRAVHNDAPGLPVSTMLAALHAHGATSARVIDAEAGQLRLAFELPRTALGVESR